MPPTEFEPTIRASKRPQSHALDRATTGIDQKKYFDIRVFISGNAIRKHDFNVQAEFLEPDVSVTDRRTQKNAFIIVGFLVRTDSDGRWKRHHVQELRELQVSDKCLSSLGRKKGKGHPCTGTEALYRPYGP